MSGGGGEYQDFPSKIFCLTVSKFFVGESFTVAFFWVPKKFAEEGGGGGIKICRFSVDFFCLTVPNFIAGEPFCAVFQKSCGSEKV